MPEQGPRGSARRDSNSPPAAGVSKRNSITNRIFGSLNQARKDATASVQRRASTSANGSNITGAAAKNPVIRIREWMDGCNAEHEGHCGPTSKPSSRDDPPTFTPTWLIDSVEKCLVRAKPKERYLALSYVWGTGPPRGQEPATQLSRGSLDAFQLGLPDKGMPSTVLDAIWLSKKLGLRYIWIDRLCIPQDDDEEKLRHINNMGYVFANAYLVVIAAFGDVYTGLLPLNSRRRPRTPKAATVKEHNELVAESRWNTRGWTLQEALYARRAVYFFEDTYSWECHCELLQANSTTTTSILKKARGGSGSGSGTRGASCTNRLSSSYLGYLHTPWPDLDEYARIASEYSARRVTVVDDTLRAFSGITNVMSKAFTGGFVYGMPLMFLDVALLWRPTASIRRRAVTKAPFLPSWSWMGWWFDGVPVDLTLWRAAADYVEDAKVVKVGQSVKRFQSPYPFKVRPTVVWRLTDRASNVPVANIGFQHRDARGRRAQSSSSSALPDGWSRAGSYFRHESDGDTLFRYPVPVEDPPEEGEYSRPTGETAFPGPFLSFRTTGGVFNVDCSITLSPRDRENPPIAVGNIWARNGKWIGEFRAHDGWLGIQTSNYDGDEKLEFVAISTATERKGSHVLTAERFEESQDEDGIVEVVNVLWVERIGAVFYRRGLGHVLLKAWEALAKEEVDVLLG